MVLLHIRVKPWSSGMCQTVVTVFVLYRLHNLTKLQKRSHQLTESVVSSLLIYRTVLYHLGLLVANKFLSYVVQICHDCIENVRLQSCGVLNFVYLKCLKLNAPQHVI